MQEDYESLDGEEEAERIKPKKVGGRKQLRLVQRELDLMDGEYDYIDLFECENNVTDPEKTFLLDESEIVRQMNIPTITGNREQIQQ